MSDTAQQSYRLVESLREHWAEIMLHALTENGHVYLDKDDLYKLKGELMQLLIGRVKI
jgi:hypothetical protein